ncbi:methyltransferase domain-containing protein [Chloroflexota bacterium]
MKGDNKKLNDLLDYLFGTVHQRTVKLINKYAALYSLPTIEKVINVDPRYFYFTTKRVYFVVLAIHNEEKEILIFYSPNMLAPKQEIGWRLAGGIIKTHKNEAIEEAVNRIVKKHIGLEVTELEPFAVVRNKFCWDHDAIEHVGLAFIVRVDGIINASIPGQKWKFTKTPPDIMAFSNKEVLFLAIKNLEKKFFELPIEEIQSSRRSRFINCFHRLLFKPIMYFFASRPLRGKILSLIPEHNSFLDVSAGDDELVLNIAKCYDPNICVANDIAWKQMAEIRSKAKSRALNILFTNHNIAELPFTEKIDIVIYKNTLHHVRSKGEILAVLGKLKAVSKRLIIIDIEDPRRERSSYLIHLYYKKIYGDGDEEHRFFTKDTFEKLIRFSFSDASKIVFDRLHTFKGTYMIAVVDF